MCEQVKTCNKQVQTGLENVTAAGIGVPAGEATYAVTGASGFRMSDDAVFNTGGILSVVFTSLSVLFPVSGSTVADAAGVDILAGASSDAVADELVGTEMFSDGADSGTGGIGDTDSFSLLVSGGKTRPSAVNLKP
jgi:hypothetical protein